MTPLETVLSALIGVIAALSGVHYGRQNIPNSFDATAVVAHPQLHYRLGGYGPFVAKTEGIVKNATLPDNCLVDQVHMLARHTERFPTFTACQRMLEFKRRINSAQVEFNGSLAFVTKHKFISSRRLQDCEQLTKTGIHAGSKTAFDLGVKLRSKYQHLHERMVSNEDKTTFWASGCQRVIETAQYFATAFFGIDWAHTAVLQVVSEDRDLGASTLTPGETCWRYEDDENLEGWAFGAHKLNQFQATYLPIIRARFLRDNPAFRFHDSDIYIMQEMCGFETMLSGSSPWCELFSEEEWISYEYARDVLHYYRSGPGNKYAAAMGWLWLNATTNLLKETSMSSPFFFSFVHDGDIFPMLTALDLFPQAPDLPTTHILSNRTWRTSDTVPMGANIIFERLACLSPEDCRPTSPLYPNHIYCQPPSNDTFVRIIVNGGVVSLPNCTSGVGQSCPLADFVDVVRRRGETLTDFADLCGLPDNLPKEIDWLHQ